jgi:pyruvate,water dikinase
MLLPLSQALDPEDCGSKAFNLGRIICSGLQSGDGFVLSSEAFQLNLSRLGLESSVVAVFGSESELKEEAASLRQAILQGGISDALHKTLSAVLEPEAVYAVRSSAVGEDGASSSFAGQFDSVLGCDSPDKVAKAVCAVWASLLNPRALAYARQKEQRLSKMAVIIQRQVAAVASGVLFTRDPRAPAGQHMIIEYCDGLGERLVSGQVTPACGLIARADGTYTDERGRETESSWSPHPPPASTQLRDLGMALETEFGCPQDIEFSVDQNDEIIVLQSRPITTYASSGPMVSWSNANIAENFPDPICVMLQSFVARGYGAYFRSLAAAYGVPRARMERIEERFDEVVACHGGRLYYNLSNIHALLYSVPGGQKLAQYFNAFTGAEGMETPTKARISSLSELIELGLMPFCVLWNYSVLPRRLKVFEDQIASYADETDRRTLDAKSPEELARLIERFLEIRLNNWTPAALSDAAAMISYGLLGTILRDKPDIDENELLQGLPGLASAAPVEALWALTLELRNDRAAETIRTQAPEDVLHQLESGALGEAGEKIQEYLDTWGFRSSGELLLIRATPQEDPISVLPLLRAYLQSQDAGPMEKSARQAEVRKDRTRIASRALGPGRRQVFRAVLWATQRSIGFRERARMKQALLYSRLRQVALASARKLVQQGIISRTDDVFHVGLDEVIDALRGASLPEVDIASRKRALSDNQSWAPPAAFVLPRGQAFNERDAKDAPLVSGDALRLRGIPACAGRVGGTAAVVLDVSEVGSIRKDQILVTQQTDPGWAAVFFLVKGLVIERGGLLSHGAIIAREYGIPAVIGVEGATKTIKNGAQIEILADIGEVHIHVE